MLISIFKVAFRKAIRNRFHFFLNLVSLITGLAVAILIGLLILHEVGYDQFHEKGDRLYRLVVETDFYGVNTLAITSEKAAPALLESVPEIESAVRLNSKRQAVIQVDDKLFHQDEVFYADVDFFRLFTFPLISGDPAHVLAAPNTIVLTTSLAKKLFGEIPVMGQILMVDQVPLTITGIVDESPKPSHLHFSCLISMATVEPQLRYNDWTRYNMTTYVSLKPGASLSLVEEKIIHLSGLMDAAGQPEQSYKLQPLRQIHLEPNLMWDVFTAVSPQKLGLWALLGSVVLLMAIMNFVNLFTARSATIMRSVSIQKLLGAHRWQMTFRFLMAVSYTHLTLPTTPYV
jgi:putative ABC transport system permease protein